MKIYKIWFDYDEDGKITKNDIKNTIIKYYDNHFFDNVKLINKKKIFKKISNIYIYIIELLKKK